MLLVPAAVLVTLASATVTGATARPPGPAYPSGPVPIATGDRDTVFYAYGYALLEALRRGSPGLEPYLVVTPSGRRNVEMVDDGTAVLGFVGADTLTALPPSGTGSLRTLARLYDDYLHLVVRRDADVRELPDLRGRRISVGPSGSGTERAALRLLRTAGMTPKQVRLRTDGVDASMDALRHGDIDAFFFFGGVPTGRLALLNRVTPVRLLDLADWTSQLRASRDTIYSRLSIPLSAYDGVPPVTTVGVPTYLVVSRDLDPDLAYAVTAMLFEQRELMARVHPAARRLDRRAAINTVPLPLHPGAVRYYRATHI